MIWDIIAVLVSLAVGWGLGVFSRPRRLVANPNDTDLLDALEQHRWSVKLYEPFRAPVFWMCKGEHGDTPRIAIRRAIAVERARQGFTNHTEPTNAA